jgi:hypothetical protein
MPKPIRQRKHGFKVLIDNMSLRVDPMDYQSLYAALRDLLALYDRVAGNVRNDVGYTAADVQRLQEIRTLEAYRRELRARL